jgi:hypothetical protein
MSDHWTPRDWADHLNEMAQTPGALEGRELRPRTVGDILAQTIEASRKTMDDLVAGEEARFGRVYMDPAEPLFGWSPADDAAWPTADPSQRWPDPGGWPSARAEFEAGPALPRNCLTVAAAVAVTWVVWRLTKRRSE